MREAREVTQSLGLDSWGAVSPSCGQASDHVCWGAFQAKYSTMTPTSAHGQESGVPRARRERAGMRRGQRGVLLAELASSGETALCARKVAHLHVGSERHRRCLVLFCSNGSQGEFQKRDSIEGI